MCPFALTTLSNLFKMLDLSDNSFFLKKFLLGTCSWKNHFLWLVLSHKEIKTYRIILLLLLFSNMPLLKLLLFFLYVCMSPCGFHMSTVHIKASRGHWVLWLSRGISPKPNDLRLIAEAQVEGEHWLLKFSLHADSVACLCTHTHMRAHTHTNNKYIFKMNKLQKKKEILCLSRFY